MTDKTDRSECKSFASLFEKQECEISLSEDEKNFLDLHSGACKNCSALTKQHSQITEIANSFPQFDVSEGLTQKILQGIEKENTPGIRVPFLPIGIAASVAFIVLVPLDSMQSMLGWGCGLIGLGVIQFIMNTANRKEQII